MDLGTVYGVVLDEAGSCDYYDSLAEAWEYGRRYDVPVVRIEATEVTCICYSTPEPGCEVHGY